MLKQTFDLIFSLIVITLVSPILLSIAILIKLNDRSSVFFTQTRLGKNGTPFKIYKFRTMEPQAHIDSDHLTLGDDKRITKIGQVLRKYKLDELPQFINVLTGDMSVVGPRPDVPSYYELKNPLHQKVLSVKPGITGFAALEYSLSKQDEAEILAKADAPEELYRKKIFPLKMALNLKYVEEKSFWLDMKLIGMTTYYIGKKLFFNR